MDSTTGGVLGIFGILISGGSVIYAAINHKRIRCRCCGKDLDMSVDVDPTDPKAKPVSPETSASVTAPIIEEVIPQEEVVEEEYVPPKKSKKSRVFPG
jgi:hypothetical protein